MAALTACNAIAAGLLAQAGKGQCGISISCAPDQSQQPQPVTPAGATACGPAAGGATCGAASGVASQGGQGGLDVGAGNPINIINGNKYQREVDLAALPGVLGLEIVRHYNSAYSTPHTATGILGRGWKLSYETDLHLIGNTIQIMQADGNRVTFSRDAKNPSLCSSTNAADGSLRINKTIRGDEFAWAWPDGRVLNFDHAGKLVQIVAATGEFLSLQRDPAGMLVQVTDPQGRQLHLQYPSQRAARDGRFHGVVRIDSPVGRFGYDYGSALPAGATIAKAKTLANLIKVTYPDGASSRIYHYEDARHPTTLTGISSTATIDAQAGTTSVQRIGTYLYDIDGKAILSVRGEPARLQVGSDGRPLQPARLVEGTGLGQVVLDFATPGRTTVTNSLGQQTVYRHAIIGGQHRVLEAIGPGCHQCGVTNVRYGWLDSGLLASITTLAEGTALPVMTLFHTFDAQGRQTTTTRQIYAEDGRALGARQLVQRQEYGTAHNQPLLIARPSVVPGRERLSRIVYGSTAATRRLPVWITETGFMPAIDGATVAQTLTRSIHYRYDERGARLEVDGPLPNAGKAPGPDNSDITLTTYDNATHLLKKVVVPGNLTTEIVSRDAALRPQVLRTSDGSTMHTTTITRNWRGQPVEIRFDAEPVDAAPASAANAWRTVMPGRLTRTLQYRYDPFGELIAITLPGNLTTRFRYDAAGRMTHRIAPDGSTVVIAQDAENRLHQIDRFTDPLGAKNDLISSETVKHDHFGHVLQIDDLLGKRIQQAHDSRGRLRSASNALGIATHLDYDDNDNLIRQTVAFGTTDAAVSHLESDRLGNAVAITDANGVKTRQWHDDFGRKVAETSPDRGITLYRHDEGGRLVARIDETGVTTRSTYDHANRIVTQGIDGQPALVRYRYAGMRLQDVTTLTDEKSARITQQTQYQYDALGQTLLERQWLAKVDVPAPSGTGALPLLRFDTANAYDDAGRLLQQTLPDGHRLGYDYAPVSSPRKDGRPGQLLAIRFDDKPVVADIRQTIAGGLTGYTMSNGIRQQITLDGRGQILQLQAIKSATGAARLAEKIPGPETTVYQQHNRYDAAGRLTDSRRQSFKSAPGTISDLRIEHFDYDAMDRLTGIQAGDGAQTTLRYDRGGNRIAQVDAAATHRYHYAPGSNRLISLTTDQPSSEITGERPTPAKIVFPTQADAANAFMEAAWFYHPTGIPLAQLTFPAGGTRLADNRPAPAGRRSSNRITYNSAKRPIAVHDENNRLIVRYHYNGSGERIAKTTYPATAAKTLPAAATPPPANGITRYSLYRNQRLAAQTNDSGRITAHYIYLYGKPVAKIEMAPNHGLAHLIWKKITALGGLLNHSDIDPDDTSASIYAIHTDHLGTPQVVTDASQAIVWQAQTSPFGEATIVHASIAPDTGVKFEMDLRLPGQLFDAETGLNYNYLRDYDPRLGRYTTPDPIGIDGGLHPYSYVANNPLTGVDPLGLYEEDVHYYMTFFLARMAGIGYQEARTIALAAQYIDDNPDTWPVDDARQSANVIPWLNSGALNRLASYHFTTTSPDWYNIFDYDPTRTISEAVYEEFTHKAATSYIERRYKDPSNPQLTRLAETVSNAPTRCAKAQFFGEYLHAFEDTFGHRSQLNAPININQGFGHAIYGHSPDKTYNHTVSFSDLANRTSKLEKILIPQYGDWNQNESRTYEMEYEVFQKLRQLNGTTGKNGISGQSIIFKDFADFLEGWNKIQSSTDKITQLAFKLDDFGLGVLPEYIKKCAEEKRKSYIGGLDKKLFQGAILPTTTGTLTALNEACKG